MRESLRKSGINIIGDVPWGTHFCQFYQTWEDLIDILVPYFKAGLENNELCMWITSQPLEVQKAKKAMKRAVPDIDVYLDKGQLEIIPYTQGYLKEDIFDPDRVVNNWIEKIDQALTRGYDGLRGSGDKRWLEKEGWNGFVDYENKVDAIIDKHRVIALCPYYLDMRSTAEIIDVVSNHQFALIKREGKWERIENSGRKRAEKEAIQAAKNWKYTFDAVPDLIAIIDDKYRIVSANRAMAAKLGTTPEECAGSTCYRAIHGTDSPPSFCHRQLLKNWAEHTAEVCEARLGGYFSVSTSPLRDSEGKIIGSIYVARDINERKQEERRIRRYNHILEGINRIFSNVVQAKTEEELGEACLSVALEVTGSQFGFINGIGSDGLLHDVAKSELAWEQCFMYDKTGHRRPPSDFAVHGLYGSIINNRKGFFTNDPSSHPDSRGLPDGHPPIRSFLGVPLIQGGKTIGLIAVANREGGYRCEQQEDLEAIVPAVVQVLQRKKAEQKRKQAEKALQVSEERYRSLYENSLDGILLTKSDGTILCANPQACQMFGMTEDEIIRAGREGIVVNDEKLEAALEERKLTGRMRAELIHRRKDGSTFVCDTTSKLFVDSDGSISTSLIIRDISERKRAEEALRESEEKYRIVADNTYDWEFWLGPDGRFLYMSPSCERVTGYAACEFIDNPDLLQEIIHPDDRHAFLQHQHDMPPNRHGDIEFRIVTKDGEIRWIHHLCQPLYNGEGHYAGSRGSNRDITDRKRAEEEVQSARNMLQLIMNNIPQGIFWKDCDSRFLGCNNVFAKAAGLESPENIIGKTDYDLPWTPEQTRLFRDYDRKIMKNDTPEYHIVERQQEADGELVWLETNKIPLHDAKGSVIGILGTYEDITKRKKAEEALKKAHDNLEKLVEERTEELEKAYESLKESEKGLAEAQKMAHIGNWEWDIAADKAYWSDEMYRIFGRDPQKLAPPYKEYLNYIHPDDRDYFSDIVKKAVNGKPYSIDYRIVLDNGEVRTIHIQSEVIFYKENTPVRIKGIVQDITERKRIEAELELVARLPQENPDPVVRLSQGRIINYANPSAQVLLTDWGSAISKEAPIEITEPSVAALGDGIRRKLEFSYANRTYVIDIAPFPGAGYVNLYAHDITERKKAKEALEKIDKTRIKEIHHRIKNNLQVISSLLDLQAERFQNKEVLEAFRESQNRITSMSLIHEELYRGGENNTLNFSTYLQKLAENLFQTYSLKSKNVRLRVDLEENTLFDMDVAVPLGIIVNELVSNSLKHAFAEDEEGEIRVKLCREEKGNEMRKSLFSLSISDNGKGIPENLELENIESLGLQLVNILVDQLGGKIELKRTHGTEFRITFNVTERL